MHGMGGFDVKINKRIKWVVLLNISTNPTWEADAYPHFVRSRAHALTKVRACGRIKKKKKKFVIKTDATRP